MAKLQKVEGQIELKCHADKFFEVWCQKPYLVTKMCPKKFPKIELHEGDWHKVGGVTTWNYVFIIA
ncbi:MLP-like protein 31 [Bienertia sinuspersici]